MKENKRDIKQVDLSKKESFEFSINKLKKSNDPAMKVGIECLETELVKVNNRLEADEYDINDIDLTTFSGRLEKSLNDSGLSMRELAIKAKISHTTVSNLLKGQDAKLEHCNKLAPALDVHLEWLAFGKDLTSNDKV